MQMGADSLNALSIIIGHELAHYYNDHEWCSDFAFASRNNPNKDKINLLTKESKIIHEIEADNWGLYHSCIAGYHPFNIYSSLLDKIYSEYKLDDKDPHYPTIKERKDICRNAENKITELYPIFKTGVVLLHIKNYSIAADCFQYLSMYFPSREVYNNLGVCRLFEALDYNEYDSLNFIYTIEVDPTSRIFQSVNRGAGKMEKGAMQRRFFQESKTAFEKALALDPQYIPAFMNLACLYDAKQNYQSALGTISEIPAPAKNDNEIKLIEAIALYHNGDRIKSSTIFSELAKTNNPLLLYNNELAKLGVLGKSSYEIESWKEEWLLQHIDQQKKICNYGAKPPLDSSNIIQISKDLILKSITYPSYERLTIVSKKKKITITIEKCSSESLPVNETKLLVLKENECFQITFNTTCWLINYNTQNDQ
jgi:tetratricopeptide (TPR) repeat protein